MHHGRRPAHPAAPAAWPSRLACGLLITLTALLAGCASTPRPADPAASPRATMPPERADDTASEGLPDRIPPDLARVPDPEPRIEPVRPGGPNKPYAVQGETYEPARGDPEIVERGIASWYGRPFHGRRTASGEVYDMYAMSAAHKTMPIPSYARVVNPANGREVVVRINDRGPFVKGRIIDLSYTAAMKLGVTRGVAPVEVSRITHEAIRTGRWKRADNATALAAATAAPATAAPAAPPSAHAAAGAPAVDNAAAATPAGPAEAFAVPAATLVTVAAVTPAPHAASAPAAAGAPDRAFTTAARGFWVQLGAFARMEGAAEFRRRVEQEVTTIAPLLAVFADQRLHRLQAGPYATRGEAQSAAEAVRSALKLVPVIVERR